MLGNFKTFVVLAMLLSAVAGCSSNKNKNAGEDAANAGSGSETSSVDSSSTEGAGDIATVMYFEYDSSVLTSEARAALTAHAEFLKSNSQNVRLEGHADERGTREYNMALGERRANAAADFLVLQGIDRARIETVSYGEERPAAQGSDESSWSQNRRVELSYN